MNPAVQIPEHDPDDVGVDQPPDLGLALLKLAVQPAVFERDGRLGGQHLEERDPRGREDARSEPVLEVEQRDQRTLFHQGQAEHRAHARCANVLVGGVRIARRGIGENHGLARACRITDNGLGKLGRGDGYLAETDRHRAVAGFALRANQELAPSRQEQQPTFRTGVFDRRAQHGVDELFEHDLARDGLRDLQHGRELQPLDRLADRGARVGGRFFLPQARVPLVQLPHLAIGAPSRVTVSGTPQIKMRDVVEAARRVESRGQLVRQSFVLDEAVFMCRPDRLLVQLLGIDDAAVDACDLRADQCRTALEILRTMRRPDFELFVMDRQRGPMLRLLFGADGITESGPGEPAIEFILRRLEKGWRRPEQRLAFDAASMAER